MEPHLPHIEQGALIVPGQAGSGVLVFSEYKPNSEPEMCGSYTLSYKCAEMQATWRTFADDYLSTQLHEFLNKCAQRHTERFESVWGNIMGDITVRVRCDGLGHFRLTVENRLTDEWMNWFARGALRLDTASMLECAVQLRRFTGVPW